MHVNRLTEFAIRCFFLTMSADFCFTNSTFYDVERLFNSTILTVHHRYRPKVNQSEPTLVYLSLMLLSLTDVDEVQQSMSSNVLLTVSWVDEIRKWDPQMFGGLKSVHPDPLDVWRPRLFLSNSIAERDMFEDNYAPLTIYYDGSTEWLPGGILHTSCSMKMTHFPYDTQTCTLTFTTGESSDMLQLLSHSSKVQFGHYDRNGEWVIEDTEVITRPVGDKSTVKFILKLNRLPSFTLLNIVIPINIISSLSSLVFIMPVESGERVSFSVTVLLSLTVYTSEISKDLPTNSESLPLLIMYLACLLLHSGFAIVANLIVLIRHFHIYGFNPEKEGSNEHISNNRKLSGSDFKDDFDSSVRRPIPVYGSRARRMFFRNAEFMYNNRPMLSHRRSRSLLVPRSYKGGLRCVRSQGESSESSHAVEGSHSFLASTKYRVLDYINMNDLILFVLFFGVWLVVTIVFMTLIAYCL